MKPHQIAELPPETMAMAERINLPPLPGSARASMIALPPMPPNMGIHFYPAFETIENIRAATKRWEQGERPSDVDRKWWPGLCAQIDALPNAEASNSGQKKTL